MVWNFVQGQSPPWLEGKVTACTGPLSYKVRSTNGCIIHHHADHLQHAARHLSVVQTDPDGWTMFCFHFLTPFLMDRLSRKIIIENCLNVLRESDPMIPGQICCIITGEVWRTIDHCPRSVATFFIILCLVTDLAFPVCTPAGQGKPVIYCSTVVSLFGCLYISNCTATHKGSSTPSLYLSYFISLLSDIP